MIENMHSPNIKHVLSISGGKDSVAQVLYAIEQNINFIAVFADTGNEHPIIHDYIEYLRNSLGIKVHIVRANFANRIANKRTFIALDMRPKYRKVRGKFIPLRWRNKDRRRALGCLYPTENPFLDLCAWKGHFPSRRASFCTEQLKRIPIFDEIHLPLLESGFKVWSWQGVRRDESHARRNAKRFEADTTYSDNLFSYRLLVDWTADDVFKMHHRHGIKPNPLYKLGFKRVGCMPCVNCGKNEIYLISKLFPEMISKIRNWEKHVSLCSKRKLSTFFPSSLIPGSSDTRSNIDNAVKWSKTLHGGKQYSLIKSIEVPSIQECTSVYGLCE